MADIKLEEGEEGRGWSIFPKKYPFEVLTDCQLCYKHVTHMYTCVTACLLI